MPDPRRNPLTDGAARSDDARQYARPAPGLVEGHDYTVEDGRWVFTQGFLLRRGTCCKSGCRNCPYGFVRPGQPPAGPAQAQ